MTSGPNIHRKQRTNKPRNLSLTPAACAVADALPGEASRLASAGLVLLGAMQPEARERLIALVASAPEPAALALESWVAHKKPVDM